MNPHVKRWTQLSLCTFFLACTACEQNASLQAAGEVGGADNKTPAINTSEINTIPDDKTMDMQIADAVTDLAARISVATDAIAVKEARSVQWGSGAMGCPKPGMNYTQAIVPGVLLLLDVNETIYHYHGREGRSLFYCPAARVRAPAYGRGLEVM